MELNGQIAIDLARLNGLTLNKYADPIEDARTGLTPEEAQVIAREDPRLIYIDIPLLVVDGATDRNETGTEATIQPWDGTSKQQDSNELHIDDESLIRALYDHPAAEAFGDMSYTVR